MERLGDTVHPSATPANRFADPDGHWAQANRPGRREKGEGRRQTKCLLNNYAKGHSFLQGSATAYTRLLVWSIVTLRLYSFESLRLIVTSEGFRSAKRDTLH